MYTSIRRNLILKGTKTYPKRISLLVIERKPLFDSILYIHNFFYFSSKTFSCNIFIKIDINFFLTFTYFFLRLKNLQFSSVVTWPLNMGVLIQKESFDKDGDIKRGYHSRESRVAHDGGKIYELISKRSSRFFIVLPNIPTLPT